MSKSFRYRIYLKKKDYMAFNKLASELEYSSCDLLREFIKWSTDNKEVFINLIELNKLIKKG